MSEDKITLKQVINKIEKMDSSHKFEWTYSILKSFGNEFISHIFKEAYEQGKFGNAMEFSKPKVEIPDYIDEWIEYCKKNNFNLLGALNPVGDFGEPIADSFKGNVQRCVKWALANSNVFADAWVNGYSVTKEKHYYVAVPVGRGVYNKVSVYYSGELFLDSRNYQSIDKLIRHSRQATYQLTEEMIKKSPLSWAWQFAKELED